MGAVNINLKELGLSEYEEKAYEALVKLGKSSASKISREAGVSYGKIYEVLAALERNGLVIVIPEKTKMFAPADPSNLMKLVDEKEKKLEQLREKVKELKQVYEVHEKEIVQMVKGKRNFYKIIREMPRAEKFSYSIKFTSEYNPEFVREVKEEIKRGVDVKTLARYDEETKTNIKKWLDVNPNIRKMGNKGVAFSIIESEAVIALINNNIILSIKDKAFIDVMKQLFEAYYALAETI